MEFMKFQGPWCKTGFSWIYRIDFLLEKVWTRSTGPWTAGEAAGPPVHRGPGPKAAARLARIRRGERSDRRELAVVAQ